MCFEFRVSRPAVMGKMVDDVSRFAVDTAQSFQTPFRFQDEFPAHMPVTVVQKPAGAVTDHQIETEFLLFQELPVFLRKHSGIVGDLWLSG